MDVPSSFSARTDDRRRLARSRSPPGRRSRRVGADDPPATPTPVPTTRCPCWRDPRPAVVGQHIARSATTPDRRASRSGSRTPCPRGAGHRRARQWSDGVGRNGVVLGERCRRRRGSSCCDRAPASRSGSRSAGTCGRTARSRPRRRTTGARRGRRPSRRARRSTVTPLRSMYIARSATTGTPTRSAAEILGRELRALAVDPDRATPMRRDSVRSGRPAASARPQVA